MLAAAELTCPVQTLELVSQWLWGYKASLPVSLMHVICCDAFEKALEPVVGTQTLSPESAPDAGLRPDKLCMSADPAVLLP